MNILYISSGISFGKFIYKHGLTFGYKTLRALARRNKITLVSFADADEEELREMQRLNDVCNNVIIVKRKRYSRLSHRLIRIGCFLTKTIVMIYKNRSLKMHKILADLNSEPDKFDVAIYDNYVLIDYVKSMTSIPKILYTGDSITLEMQEMLKSPHLKILNRLELLWFSNKIKKIEKNYYRDFSKCIVAADRDRDTLLKLNPKLDVEVLPFYVDTEYFKKSSSEDDNILIFTGVFWTEHNVDAICYFYNEIFSLIKNKNQDTSLLLVGGAIRKEISNIAMKDSSVHLIDFVEDIRPYLNRATIFISPMRIGSGMNNKLLEAMSMGKAIVTTEYGNRGIDLKNEFEAIVCKDKYEFANAALDLLKNKEKRDFIGANARRKAEKDFSFEVYSHRLQEIIEKVADKGLIQRK